MLLLTLAAAAGTPGPVLDALATVARTSHHTTLLRTLAARPDLPDHTLRELLTADPGAIEAVMSRPGISGAHIAALVPQDTAILTTGGLPVPDPDGVFAAALTTRYPGRAAWAYLLANAGASPATRTQAAVRIASARRVTPAQERQIVKAWHEHPEVRDQLLRAAGAHGLQRRLGALHANAQTPADTLATGSLAWLCHPTTSTPQILAVLAAHHDTTLWSNAVSWVHDPHQQIAAHVTTTAYIGDRPLTCIVDDTTRPLTVRAAALTALARAHRPEAFVASHLERCDPLLATLTGTQADALAAVGAAVDLGAALLTRPDTTSERVQTIVDALWPPAQRYPSGVDLLSIGALLALHPAATHAQRERGELLMAGAADTGQLLYGDGARDMLVPATLARRVLNLGPVPAVMGARVQDLGRLHGTAGAMGRLLLADVLGPALLALPVAAQLALVRLAPTFTATVGELLATCTEVAR